MNCAGQQRIVEVKDIRVPAIDERRFERIDAFATAEDWRLRWAGKRLDSAERCFHRHVPGRADRASKEI